MHKYLTERRLARLKSALRQRQFSLSVAIENIHDPHNVSAIFRTCDAVGVPKVNLIYNTEKLPRISKVTSASAFKWVSKQRFTTVEECFDHHKKEGFKIYSSLLDENSISLYDIDLTKKSLIVLGNENRGVSEEAIKLSDETYYIPMRGMVQSLNVSVAAAVTLYEAQRQRLLKGMYDNTTLSDEEFDKLLDEWSER
ncbi:trna (guanosine(18)-2'-o)-methyltransferase [hydrocarbon metagenome]|uniref:Trna (Guanosine(18)-2'-o)-methyltransferase n=1 Tax=hydrocarbon metagenome TaxID=938273 RepID=A0A0W8FWV8_9ZZZZ